MFARILRSGLSTRGKQNVLFTIAIVCFLLYRVMIIFTALLLYSLQAAQIFTPKRNFGARTDLAQCIPRACRPYLDCWNFPRSSCNSIVLLFERIQIFCSITRGIWSQGLKFLRKLINIGEDGSRAL